MRACAFIYHTLKSEGQEYETERMECPAARACYFRSLLDDPVVAKFADLTDRMEAGASGCGPVCDAVAQFEAALFEHTTNWGSYLSAAVLEAETVCVRQAAAGTLAPVLQTALDSELAFCRPCAV